MLQTIRNSLISSLSVILCLFTLLEVNFPRLQPQSELALFVMLGLILCFLLFPSSKKYEQSKVDRLVSASLALGSIVTCLYVVITTEPVFRDWFPTLWPYAKSLGDRAGIENRVDIFIGVIGLLLVIEATRRAIGWAVPILASIFLFHTYYCFLAAQGIVNPLPMWLLPHAGQGFGYMVSTTFAQSLGVFGPAASVMMKYVFLFVVFGAFLEMSGATKFIISFAEKLFGKTPGGPAKVSVLGSGLMGSLSGSAVANAVTTGAFTIPMMRNSGFKKHVAAGITAAAAAGGALVPPVMGAGAYMMLELVQPRVTFLQVARSALIPAILYYLSIFLIVHFYAGRIGTKLEGEKKDPAPISRFQGLVFFSALTTLIIILILGFTPFKAVSGSLVVILILSMIGKGKTGNGRARQWALAIFFLGLVFHQTFLSVMPSESSFRLYVESYINSCLVGVLVLIMFGLAHSKLRKMFTDVFIKAAKNGVPLIAASACVGIIIGVVQATGIASDFSSIIKDVVESNLFLALLGIMICSIILGMGVPSVVCYLLMATLMGSLLHEMGVQPLAAHLFIFYFGMMSMVTPPVALAAYASASIAGAKVMKTAVASFCFTLVGFTLPFMFVYRPELLLLEPRDTSTVALNRATTNMPLDFTSNASLFELFVGLGSAVLGIVAISSATAGYFKGSLTRSYRLVLFICGITLLLPYLPFNNIDIAPYVNLVGGLIFMGFWIYRAYERGLVEKEI